MSPFALNRSKARLIRAALLLALAVLLYFRFQPRSASVGIPLYLVASHCDKPWGLGESRTVVLNFAPNGHPRINQDSVTKGELADRLRDIFALRAEKLVFAVFPKDMSLEESAEYLDLVRSAEGDMRIMLITPAAEMSACNEARPAVLIHP